MWPRASAYPASTLERWSPSWPTKNGRTSALVSRQRLRRARSKRFLSLFLRPTEVFSIDFPQSWRWHRWSSIAPTPWHGNWSSKVNPTAASTRISNWSDWLMFRRGIATVSFFLSALHPEFSATLPWMSSPNAPSAWKLIGWNMMRTISWKTPKKFFTRIRWNLH